MKEQSFRVSGLTTFGYCICRGHVKGTWRRQTS